jgi:hypothetical protein
MMYWVPRFGAKRFLLFLFSLPFTVSSFFYFASLTILPPKIQVFFFLHPLQIRECLFHRHHALTSDGKARDDTTFCLSLSLLCLHPGICPLDLHGLFIYSISPSRSPPPYHTHRLVRRELCFRPKPVMYVAFLLLSIR